VELDDVEGEVSRAARAEGQVAGGAADFEVVVVALEAGGAELVAGGGPPGQGFRGRGGSACHAEQASKIVAREERVEATRQI